MRGELPTFEKTIAQVLALFFTLRDPDGHPNGPAELLEKLFCVLLSYFNIQSLPPLVQRQADILAQYKRLDEDPKKAREPHSSLKGLAVSFHNAEACRLSICHLFCCHGSFRQLRVGPLVLGHDHNSNQIHSVGESFRRIFTVSTPPLSVVAAGRQYCQGRIYHLLVISTSKLHHLMGTQKDKENLEVVAWVLQSPNELILATSSYRSGR
jgi:hypothetical protein